MATLLIGQAERAPEQIAVLDESTRRSWAELNGRVNQVAKALARAGLATGDHVALLSGNRCEFQEVALGCMHAGLVLVPVNWHSAASEVAYVLGDCGARALVVDERFADVAAKAVAELDRKPAPIVIVIGSASENALSYEELLAAQSAAEPVLQPAGSTMFYTSGTTGRPKGVRTWYTERTGSAASIAGRLAPVRPSLGVPPAGVTLLCGPAYHSGQFFWGLTATLSGAKLVIRHRFDPADTLTLIDRHQVAAVHLVPTQFIRLLRLPEALRQQFDGASLACVVHGAGPCSPDVKRQMIDWWGPKLVEYYGATEIGTSTVIGSTEWLQRPGSVGQAAPSCRIEIIRDDGTPAPPGEDGQIYVRDLLGRDFQYHGDDAKTAEAHREPGVFTFGDIGHLDDDGYLYLSDRKADLIISGGVNIYPAEIEAVLITHPAVEDVAVFGIPNDEFGEEVKAAVVVADGHTADEALGAELAAHCGERLAGFKVPRSFDFEDHLPRHASGKLYKRLLRDRYWDGLNRRI